MQKDSSQPNITDVAKLAGVAPSTVSRVINNPDRVRPNTLEKVNSAIDNLGYKPNILARSMRTGKTSTIAVVLPDITNLFFPELIGGIEMAAQKRGYRLFICNSDEDTEKEKVILQDLLHRNVDGIILSSVSGQEDPDLIKRVSDNIPLVIVDRMVQNIEVNSVTVDDYKGIYKSTKYFLDNGHENIAYIGGFRDRQIHKTRFMGYKKALEDSGLSVKKDFVIEENFKASGGRKATEKLLNKNRVPTAIIAANDMMAIGAIRVLNSRGFNIPEDIEIIGFDNIPLATLTVPSLSTVAQPIKEMGLEAVNILFEKIKHPKRTPKEVLLKTSLILRETTN